MNSQHFRYALEIERCGSINKAAQSLYVSQPALSLAIKELESELGFDIFERSSRGILPTQEGAKFLHAIKDVINQMDQVISQYGKQLNHEEPAVLRISTARYSFTTNAVIEFFNQHFSGLSSYFLTILEEENKDVFQDILNRKSDVGIIHTCDIVDGIQRKRMEEKGIEFVSLFTSKAHVTFRGNHPLHQATRVDYDNIIHYPQIRFWDHELDYYTNDSPFSFTKYGDPGKNIYTNSRAFLYRFIENTDAVVLGTTSAGICKMHPILQTVPIQNDETEFYLYAVKPSKHTHNPWVNKFISILKKQAPL